MDEVYDITTYPFLIQTNYVHLPQILLNKNINVPELSEHDDYVWFDVTDPYSKNSYRASFYHYVAAFRYALQNKGSLPIYRSPDNEHVISLQTDLHQGIPETMKLSDIALKLLIRYVAYTVRDITPPEGIERPNY